MWTLLKGKYFLPTNSVNQLQNLYDEKKERKGKTALTKCSASEERKVLMR